MERKQKYAANLKRCNSHNKKTPAANSVIPKTVTSMYTDILQTQDSFTKESVSLNDHTPQYRNTRQRTNKQILSKNTNCNINASENLSHIQLKQQHLQSTTLQKNQHPISNQAFMSIKAAACIASPMEQLAAVHAKATSSRNKKGEAINDLKSRIPKIENIFDLHGRIGNGTFSTVLLATLKQQRDLPDHIKRKFAIKHHIPTSHPDRIMKELQYMAKIGGANNVVGIDCCIRCNESVAFIMPYLAHDRFHDFYNKMDVAEVQLYMKNLLIALRHVHHFNVIHRDVKPSNFLYNRLKKQFLLVDFGLAQQMPSSNIGLTQSNSSSLVGVFENLALPATSKKIVMGGGEGKRPVEDDDTSVEKSLEAAVVVTGTDVIAGGTAKRLRCSAPLQEQQTLAALVPSGPVTRAASACANSGLKGAVASGGSNASVYERKSAGVTVVHTMSNRLQQKLRAQEGAESVPHSSIHNTSSAGGGKNTPPPPTQPATNSNTGNNNNTTDNKYNTNRSLSSSNSPKCYCYGHPQVCNICLVKKEIHASRAGTPGYRPPEVLLKYPDQTTAVDIWAAGVIFLSILTSVYPFFKAPNDYVALAEMITIFGDRSIRKTACVLDRLVTLSQKTKPLDLRKLCVRFKNRAKFSSPELLKKYQRTDGTCEVCKNCDQFFFNCLCLESPFTTEPIDGDDMFPSSAYDLLYRLLEINPHMRITADEALSHPFFVEYYNNNNNNNTTTSNSTSTAVTTSAPAPVSDALLNTTLQVNFAKAAGDAV